MKLYTLSEMATAAKCSDGSARAHANASGIPVMRHGKHNLYTDAHVKHVSDTLKKNMEAVARQGAENCAKARAEGKAGRKPKVLVSEGGGVEIRAMMLDLIEANKTLKAMRAELHEMTILVREMHGAFVVPLKTSQAPMNGHAADG